VSVHLENENGNEIYGKQTSHQPPEDFKSFSVKDKSHAKKCNIAAKTTKNIEQTISKSINEYKGKGGGLITRKLFNMFKKFFKVISFRNDRPLKLFVSNTQQYKPKTTSSTFHRLFCIYILHKKCIPSFAILQVCSLVINKFQIVSHEF